MSRHVRLALFGAAVVVFITGCPQCAPDRVAEGVAQLTVRNVGAMVSLLNADTACGFASDDVLAAPTVDGEIGGPGTLTFTVTDCTIDLGATAPVEVTEDCNGAVTSASGAVTLTATRTIAGTLTGDAANPIVPAGPDAVTITISEATFTDFEVTKSTSASSLLMRSGSLSAVAKPRLAVSASSGACAIATPNVAFSAIEYAPSRLFVTSEDNQFDVDVATSSLTAQNGTAGDGTENALSGTITVFDSDQILSDIELDPDYDAAVFTESYACTEDLASPESYVCADLKPLLADGAARLTVKMLGTVAGLVDADTSCGFASDAVLGAGVVDGAPGGDGSLTLTVTDCEIAFPAEAALDEDCNGDATTVVGSITVSGTKTIEGRFTGNAASPIVPLTDQPAAIALTITIGDDGFRVGSTADDNALTAESGTLAGTVRPKVFIGADTGVCSVSSPNAGFDDVTWADATLLVTSSSGTFALPVDAAALEAANGTSASGTNELDGTITIDGEALTVPSDGAGLDPAFDQAALDASWQCDPALADPVSDACAEALTGTVAGGIAALSARTLGTIVSLVDADTTCGFSSVPVAVVGATFAGGEVGDDDVTATFTLPAKGCSITLPADTVVATDCAGVTTSVSGTVVVRGTKTVTGWRTGDPAEPIIPNTGRPASFDLDVTMTDFAVASSASTAVLTVTSGGMSGTVQPRVALDPLTGACSIATPNVTFTDMAWTDPSTVTLTSDGSSFTETLTASDLDAQSGSDGAAPANTLAGSLTLDGAGAVAIDGPLDPAFDQAAFDAGYQCEANGDPVLVPDAACSFKQALGVGTARLLVKAVATAVSVHDGNDVCGFAADAAPVPAPSGTPPAPGTLTFDSPAACQSGFVEDTTIATDCVGVETHAEGGFVVAQPGEKVVEGLFTGLADPSFVPVTRDAATLTLDDITFAGWRVADTDLADVVATSVTVTSGTASVEVAPVAGRNDAASSALGQGVFTERTGVAAVTGLVMDAADIVIFSEGKTFNLALTDVDLDAFVGAFFDDGALVGANDLAGTLTVDGEPVTIAPDTALDPDYDQAAFDATYTCNPALGDPPDVVPSAG